MWRVVIWLLWVFAGAAYAYGLASYNLEKDFRRTYFRGVDWFAGLSAEQYEEVAAITLRLVENAGGPLAIAGGIGVLFQLALTLALDGFLRKRRPQSDD